MILPSASPLTWTLSLAAAAAYAVSATGSTRADQTLSRIAVWLAWCLHGCLLAWGLWGGERPLFGFAPALSITAWLPLHWALGIASYGLFAVAVIHAWMMTRAEARIRSASEGFSGMPLLTMERLTFRFVNVGFVLLSATLIAGFFFGSQLYGSAHALKWDHKTIFSVLSWLTFGVLLIGRERFGWRGRKAVRVLYIGSGLLLLAYVGSRFVLEVVLERAL